MGKIGPPGQYILICWNDGHARSTPPHPFTVEYAISDDLPPKEDVTVKLIDFRYELLGRLRKGMQVIRLKTPGHRCMKWTFSDCTTARR
jgi:hypothetical protein